MRKNFIFVLIAALLGQPILAAAAHLCTDRGALHLCADACPSENAPEPAQHEENEGHDCCAAASFAVIAVQPAGPAVMLRACSAPEAKVSNYLNPSRDVFHPPV